MTKVVGVTLGVDAIESVCSWSPSVVISSEVVVTGGVVIVLVVTVIVVVVVVTTSVVNEVVNEVF